MVKVSKIKYTKKESLCPRFDLPQYVSITRELLLSNNVYENLVGVIAATGSRIIQLFYPEKYQLITQSTHSLYLHQIGGWVEDYAIGTIFESEIVYDVWQSAINSQDIRNKLLSINDCSGGRKNGIVGHKLIDANFTDVLNKIISNKYFFIPMPYHLQSSSSSMTGRILRHCYATIIASRDSSDGDHRIAIFRYQETLNYPVHDFSDTDFFFDPLTFPYLLFWHSYRPENMYYQLLTKE